MKKKITLSSSLINLEKRFFKKGKTLNHLEKLWFRQSIGRLLNRHKYYDKEQVINFLQLQQGAQKITDLRDYQLFARAFQARKELRADLSWSHYKVLSRIKNRATRLFYTQIAGAEQWSLSDLHRQINTRYYARCQAMRKPVSLDENLAKISTILKKEYVVEFTDLDEKEDFSEQELEDQLIKKLRQLMTELGPGYAFVARQKKLSLDTGKQFYVDLVFYNYLQKRFVLLELKKGALSHRAIGQIDMYVRLYDRKYRQADDKPTIGIIFCQEIDPALEEYSMLGENGRLFAAVYQVE